jgi:hypothetical protein
MRRELPDHDRPFRVPGGNVIPFLAFYSSNLIVLWAGWDTDWKLFAAVGLGFVVLGIFYLTHRQDMPPLDFKAGATWLLPWMAGLCLISYLGDYPEKSSHAGNRAAIGFGWGFLAMFLLSVLVWALAMRVRLPRSEVERHVEDTAMEAKMEEQELGAAYPSA